MKQEMVKSKSANKRNEENSKKSKNKLSIGQIPPKKLGWQRKNTLRHVQIVLVQRYLIDMVVKVIIRGI